MSSNGSHRPAAERRRIFKACSTLEKIVIILIGAAALVMAVLSVIAAWKSIALAEQALASQTNATLFTADMSWQIYLAADRLFQLINATLMGDRLLFMQLCADHPNISSACPNVSMWSKAGAYADTALLPALYPKQELAPNDTPSQPRAGFQPPSVISTPGGVAAVAGSVFSGLVLAAVLTLF